MSHETQVGTAFTIEHLRQTSPQASAVAPDHGAGQASGNPPGTGGGLGARLARILVVDDEASVTAILSDYLTEHRYDIVTAQSGAEALERLASDRPDAILLDLHMPGMDGIETLRRIQARDAHVPVLMITGNDDLAVAREALGLGAFDHILKPIDFDYLSRAVAKMLGAKASGTLPSATPSSTSDLLYDLALEVFRLARSLPSDPRKSLGTVLEQTALGFVQRGAASEKASERTETLRGINNLRTLLRFAKDLGDIDDETHRRLESRIVRARSSMGLG